MTTETRPATRRVETYKRIAPAGSARCRNQLSRNYDAGARVVTLTYCGATATTRDYEGRLLCARCLDGWKRNVAHFDAQKIRKDPRVRPFLQGRGCVATEFRRIAKRPARLLDLALEVATGPVGAVRDAARRLAHDRRKRAERRRIFG